MALSIQRRYPATRSPMKTPDFSPTVSQSQRSVALVIGLSIMLLILFGALADVTEFTPLVYFQVLAYIFLILTIARYTPGTFALMAKTLFGWFLTAFSGIAIAHEALLPETLSQGLANGAFLRLTAVHFIFALTLILTVEPRVRRILSTQLPSTDYFADTQTHLWVPVFFAGLGCYLLANLAVGLVNGFPVFSGMDRFEYRGQFSDNFLFTSFFSNVGALALFLGVISANTQGFRHKMSGIFILTMLVVAILYGDKFGSLVTILINYSVPGLLFKAKTFPWRRIISLLPIVVGATAIVLITIPIILNVYGWSDSGSMATERLLTRIAAQGQLWFLADRDYSVPVHFDGAALSEDITLMMTWGAQGNPRDYMSAPYAGLYNLMAVYTPIDYFNFIMRHGGGLTMALYAYLLKCYGWLGVITGAIVIGFIYGLHLLYLTYAVATRNPIRLFLILKLLVWIEFGIGQGTFFFIMGIKNIVWICLIMLFEVIWSVQSKAGPPARGGPPLRPRSHTAAR